VAAALSLGDQARQGDSVTSIMNTLPDDTRHMHFPMYVHATSSMAEQLVAMGSLFGMEVKMDKTTTTGLRGYPIPDMTLFSGLS